MKKLSAAEAIGPAWEHTKDLMLRPFRMGRYLKLGMVALLAQMASSGFNIGGNVPRAAQLGTQGHHLPTIAIAPLIGLVIGGIFISIIIGFVLFYVASRMQFVMFESIARRQDYIAPLWSHAGPKTWRWIGIKLLVGLGYIIVIIILAAATLPFLIGSFMHLSEHNSSDNVVSTVGAGIVLPLIGLVLGILLAVFALWIIMTLLRDIALPYMSLENLGIGDAIRRTREFIRESPGEVALFVLLKLALTIATAIVGEIILLIAIIISAAPVALVFVPLYIGMHNHGTAAMVAFVVMAVIGGLIFLAWLFLLTAALFGYIYMFLQTYAAYFLGSRYQLLGDLLEPPIAPPLEPTPVTA